MHAHPPCRVVSLDRGNGPTTLKMAGGRGVWCTHARYGGFIILVLGGFYVILSRGILDGMTERVIYLIYGIDIGMRK